jgi:tripartite-type tricarboxylate transporter receptor subunit TctC
MALPETREQIERIGLVPVETGSPEDLQRFVTSEIARWRKVVEKSGASVE